MTSDYLFKVIEQIDHDYMKSMNSLTELSASNLLTFEEKRAVLNQVLKRLEDMKSHILKIR